MAVPSIRRISLRSLFLLTTIIAIGVAVYLRQARINGVVSNLIAKGATVRYHPSVVPGWPRLFGGFFADAQSIDLSHSRVDNEDLLSIPNLTRLESLYLARTRVKSKGVATISQVESLRRLALWGNQNVGNGSIDSLLKLRNLEVLDLHDTRVQPGSLPRLLELPSLKHLVFSADFSSDESTWIDEGDVEQLARIRATPVGRFYCREMTDDGLAQLRSLDTSRLVKLTIRDSPISGEGLHHLHGLGMSSLAIQSCPVTDEDIESIPWGEVDHFSFSRTQITLAGLADSLGDRCRSIELSTELFSLYGQSSFRSYDRIVRFLPSDPEVDAAAIRKLTGLERLSFTRSHYPQILEALKEANPSIKLSANLPKEMEDSEFWNAIGEMQRLIGLKVINPPPGMAFSPSHQLEQLTLTGEGVTTNDAALQEIAKLETLRFLWLANPNPLGNQVRHLTRLKNLRTLRVHGLTDEALSHAPQMSITHLDVNDGRHITEAGLKQIENRTFQLDIGKSRYPANHHAVSK